VPLLQMMPAIPNRRGRERTQPHAILADRGYGFPWTIAAVERMGIVSKLAPRGSPHGSGLGKKRYVVERNFANLGHCRRLKLCYEKCGQHFQAFHELAMCLLCFKRLRAAGPRL